MEAISTSLDITPNAPLPPACRGALNAPSRGTGFPLEANLLGLRENGQFLVIVSVDWFFPSPMLRKRILDRCTGRLYESGLVVAASHTHSSPNPDTTKVGFSSVDISYVDWVETSIADRVAAMLESDEWRPARLRFSTAACDLAIHRRRRIWKVGRRSIRRAMWMFPNPEGPRDRELRLMRIEDAEGELLAVMWGYSCHPNDWPQPQEISSDYPGGVRQALRKAVGVAVPIVFLQGYCGTLRPPSIGRWPHGGSWRSRILALLTVALNGPTFVGFTERAYMQWMNEIAESAQQALQNAASTPPLSTQLALRRKELELAKLGITGEIERLGLHSVEIHEKLLIIGISAEVCWEYAELVRRRFPHAIVWPLGYTDSVFGYLPTGSMVTEGGYETDAFMQPFGIRGKFVSNVDEVVMANLE